MVAAGLADFLLLFLLSIVCQEGGDVPLVLGHFVTFAIQPEMHFSCEEKPGDF